MMLIRSLERYFVLCTLGFLATMANFQARGVSDLVAAALGGGVSSRARAAPRLTLMQQPRTADAIALRNPFDSVTGPLITRPPMRIATLVNPDPLAAPQCVSPLAVIVTQSREPASSLATLQTSLDARPQNRRVGDVIAGKTIEFIGYNPAQSAPSVWLSSADGLCQSQLFRPRATQGTTPSARLAPAAAVTVSRVQSALLSQVRVVPEQKNGQVIGIRLFGIRSDGLLAMIGLQNGDRLESINGFSLGTPAQALVAYAHLRTASRLNVKVERRGQPVTLGYRID